MWCEFERDWQNPDGQPIRPIAWFKFWTRPQALGYLSSQRAHLALHSSPVRFLIPSSIVMILMQGERKVFRRLLQQETRLIEESLMPMTKPRVSCGQSIAVSKHLISSLAKIFDFKSLIQPSFAKDINVKLVAPPDFKHWRLKCFTL